VPDALDFSGLSGFGPEKFAAANTVDPQQWQVELQLHDELLGGKLKSKVPAPLLSRYRSLVQEFR
jgi:hypothetical protein